MKMSNFTDDYFVSRGYERYERTPFQSEELYLYNFQKRFDDNIGKKYFINVHKLTNEWMRDCDKHNDWYEPYSYTYSCQLYKKGTYAPVDMEFFSDWAIGQVEKFVENLFQNGELDYYEEF